MIVNLSSVLVFVLVLAIAGVEEVFAFHNRENAYFSHVVGSAITFTGGTDVVTPTGFVPVVDNRVRSVEFHIKTAQGRNSCIRYGSHTCAANCPTQAAGGPGGGTTAYGGSNDVNMLDINDANQWPAISDSVAGVAGPRMQEGIVGLWSRREGQLTRAVQVDVAQLILLLATVQVAAAPAS